MKLSICIVNYKVKEELSECLISIQKAMQTIETEVFVVDNNSQDGSCELIRESYPWVHLIANTENIGFARANNQAIRSAQGEYILILNPDTILVEDTISMIISFMESHPDAGALGVRMVDSYGHFLPESKRGFPSPWVAFCKISGLYRLFPHSDTFNHYYLGALAEHETSPVEILAGACMLLRRTVLDEVGLFDEAYFLYGEDIDISYRILCKGYTNYYYPETTIIHRKGASTRKLSYKSVRAFYAAMRIFSDTHLGYGRLSIMRGLIHLGISFRESLALIHLAIFRKF